MTLEKVIEIIQIIPSVSRNVDEETLLPYLNINEATNSLTAIREIESVSLSSHYNIIIDYCKNIKKINQVCYPEVNRRM